MELPVRTIPLGELGAAAPAFAPVRVLPRRGRIVVLSMLCLAFLSLAVFTDADATVRLIVVAIFGVGLVVTLLGLLPALAHLDVDEHGVHLRGIGSSASAAWTDVHAVGVLRASGGVRTRTCVVLVGAAQRILLEVDCAHYGDVDALEPALSAWLNESVRRHDRVAGEGASAIVAEAAEIAAQAAPHHEWYPVRSSSWLVTKLVAAVIVAATAVEFVRFGVSPTTAELARAGGLSTWAVVSGDWWKLLAANLLHVNLVHVLLNMVVFTQVARVVEQHLGRTALLASIVWSAVIASIGALVLDAGAVGVGASGVVFGIVGTALAADPRGHSIVGRIAWALLPINLLITFTVPQISKGAHLGGLVAGALVGLACANPRAGTLRAPRAARLALASGVVVAAVIALAPVVAPGLTRPVQRSAGRVLVERRVGSGASCTAAGHGSTDFLCTTADGGRIRVVVDPGGA